MASALALLAMPAAHAAAVSLQLSAAQVDAAAAMIRELGFPCPAITGIVAGGCGPTCDDFG